MERPQQADGYQKKPKDNKKNKNTKKQKTKKKKDGIKTLPVAKKAVQMFLTRK